MLFVRWCCYGLVIGIDVCHQFSFLFFHFWFLCFLFACVVDLTAQARPAGSTRAERRAMAQQRKQLEASEAIEAKKALESAADLQTIDKLLAQTKRTRATRAGGKRKGGDGLRLKEVSGGAGAGVGIDGSGGGGGGGEEGKHEEATDQQQQQQDAVAIDSQVESITQKALAERRKLKLLEQISRAARTEGGWGEKAAELTGGSKHNAGDDGTVVHDLENIDDDDEAESTLGYLAMKAKRAW